MRRWVAVVVPVVPVVLGASACSLLGIGTSPAPIDDGITVLAKVDGWSGPLSTDESLGVNLVVEIAYDEDAARAAWADSVPADLPGRSGEPRESGRYGSLDDVDLAEQALVVYSAGQSGACPGWLTDFSVDGDVLAVAETEHVPGNACTDDFDPYRLVLAVDRDKLPAADRLPLRTARDGDREFDALVTRYPAA